MTSQLPALCLSCAHRAPTADALGSPTVVRCAAYPAIPFDIGGLGGDHRQARGDEAGGVTYRMDGGPQAAALYEAWLAFSQASPQALPEQGR